MVNSAFGGRKRFYTGLPTINGVFLLLLFLSFFMWCVRGGTNLLSLQIVVVWSAGRVKDISQRCYRVKEHFSKMV